MERFSIEKAAKFSTKDRYFNVNHLWAPGFMWVVEKLYYTSVRPEFVVFISFVTGLLSAYLYSTGSYILSIIAAFLILLKNFFDFVDGHLARAKGLTSRLGRFLDSLSDAAVYVCLFTGIAYNLSEGELDLSMLLFSYLAMLMAFIQCSFYNYYVVKYKTYLYGEGINKTDESFSEEDKQSYKEGLYGLTVFILQWTYKVIYGWQDSLVSTVDRFFYSKFITRNSHLSEKELEIVWYKNKKFLSLFAFLSFGTQIFALTLFTILGNIMWFLISLMSFGGLYTIFILFVKAKFSFAKATIEDTPAKTYTQN